jgi:V/A-type H+/Na+-transporting ATPase subunit A
MARTTAKKTVKSQTASGELVRIAGPVVVAKGLQAAMYDLVRVGEEGLLGEVIQIKGERTVIQVYEDTTGLKPGDIVVHTPEPLSVELGPGLLSSIYDGIQRPLPLLEAENGAFLKRGVSAPALDPKIKWEFHPTVKAGDKVTQGNSLGWVQERSTKHQILVPPNMSGTIKKIESGAFTIRDTIAVLDNGTELKLSSRWPVRFPRPVLRKLQPKTPLITGQRVFDTLFPLSKGGAGAIPGPFGAGKTVNQKQLAKWSDADIIVYIGCGERGNEMTEILTEFPHLVDPKTGNPLMDRTVLIANTSNMPVAAREASIYTGVTIAEYFRDMGYDVALMADSTSRWAEAMREIGSRLEEMPGEEGFPAYLSTRLSQFYERAARADTFNGKKGSVSIIGAVSPPGGDFSEPVTQNTLRVTKTFWALDHKLSQRRHFPAINWLTSYSLYHDLLEAWYMENVANDWKDCVRDISVILQEEEKLLEIVQLVGSDALPEKQQIILATARIVREGFLQQNAFHEVDSYCSLQKSYALMKAMLYFHKLAMSAAEQGVRVHTVVNAKSKDKLLVAKYEKDAEKYLATVQKEMEQEFLTMVKR